jgi:RNA polymerase sigma-32 factor
MSSASTFKELTYYFAIARNEPLLGREEEADLARRWKMRRDQRAADALARCHFRQVVGIAMKYRHYGVPVGELVAEGNFGVVHALARFEPERGLRFATYANYWVRAHILSYVIKSYSAVGGSGGALRPQVFFKLRRERVRVSNQFGTGEAAEQALAECMGMSIERVRSMTQRLDARDVSFDARDPQSTSLLDSLPATQDQEAELSEREVQGKLGAAVRDALDRLDRRERYIVDRRLLVERDDESSLAEIARQLGVSRERARQLEVRAKNKLRRSIAAGTDPVVLEWLEGKAPAEATGLAREPVSPRHGYGTAVPTLSIGGQS